MEQKPGLAHEPQPPGGQKLSGALAEAGLLKLENSLRKSSLEHCGHATDCSELRKSFSNRFSQRLQAYSKIGMETSFLPLHSVPFATGKPGGRAKTILSCLKAEVPRGEFPRSSSDWSASRTERARFAGSSPALQSMKRKLEKTGPR